MKKIVVFLFLFVFSLTIALNVNAVGTTVLKVSENEVNLGEEIIISIDLNDNKEETSLYAYTAKLSYDKDVFEVIKTEDFQEQENWSDIVYNQKNNKFALINKKGISEEKLLQIKLKVREDATPGKTTITLNSIKASDGKKDIPLESKTVEVMVIKGELLDGESIPTNSVGEVAEENTSIKVEKDFPWIVIILIILMIAIVVFIIYYQIKSSQEWTPKNKRIAITVVSVIILIVLFILTIKILFNIDADVNKDGQVDYDDTKEIMEYLLEIKDPDENISDADVNGDGQITIGDVAASADKSKDQNHSANVSGSSDNTNSKNNKNNKNNSSSGNNKGNNNQGGNSNNSGNNNQGGNNQSGQPNDDHTSVVETSTVNNLTPKKGELITLNLCIDITPYTQVKAVEIGGTFYPVEKIETTPAKVASLQPILLGTNALASELNANSNYKVTIPAPSKAGVYDIKVNRVELDNGKIIATNNIKVATIDVLKDKPTIEGFKIDGKKEVPEISFTIKDPDGAFEGGTFTITDEKGEIILTRKIARDEIGKVIEITTKLIEDGKTYSYNLKVNYDLDHDYFDKDEAIDHEIENESFVDKELEFKRDYNFIAKNVKITEKVTSKDELLLTFENGYDSFYKVDKVNIDGKEYKVEGPVNGVYTVKLPKIEEKGREESITIKSVTLKNGASYEVGLKLKYIYLKDIPTIDSIEAQLNDNKVYVTVNTTDIDSAINEVTVYLKDKQGNVVKEVEIPTDSNFTDISLNDTNEYTIEVVIVYDLGDGENVTVRKTYEGTIRKAIKVTKISATLPKEYVEKNGNVEVIFDIEDNTEQEVTYILINGVKVPALKQQDKTYKVSFNAPEKRPQDGIVKHTVTKIYYGEEEVTTPECMYQFEVLKSAPTVEIISIDLASDSPVLNFKLYDEEDTFVRGRIIITDENGNIKNSTTFGKNETSKELKDIELEQSVTYTVQIEVTYDLDSIKDETASADTNTYTEVLAEDEFIVENDYQINIQNLELVGITEEIATLKFTVTNETENNHYIEKVIFTGMNGKEYTVERDGYTYTVEIPTTDFSGTRTILKIKKVIFDTLIGIDVNLDNGVLLFKYEPTILDKDFQLQVQNNTIQAEFTITDTDETISSVYALLIDEEGNPVGEQIEANTLENGNYQVTFEQETAGTYKVQILAEYDRLDGKGKQLDVIYTSMNTAKIDIVAKITAIYIDGSPEYVQRDSQLALIFDVESNANVDITSVKVNNDTYREFETLGNGKYRVTVTTPEQINGNRYGKCTYQITELQYETKTIAFSDTQDNPQTSTYVLKIAPTVEVHDFKDWTQPATVTVTFIDNENTLKSGNIVIKKNNGDQVLKQELTTGKTLLELGNLTESGIYKLTLEGLYDLDDDQNDEANADTNTYDLRNLIDGNEIELKIITNYQLQVDNVILKDIDKENEKVKISFTSSNAGGYDVQSIVINGNPYEAIKQEDGSYIVEIPYEDEINTTYVMQQVTLSNGKELEIESKPQIEVFKPAPIAVTRDGDISENQDTITAKVEITDQKQTIINKYAVLKNSAGEKVDEVELTSNVEDVTFHAKNSNIFDIGTYTIEVEAIYDLANGEVPDRKNIMNPDTDPAKVEVTIHATIASSSISNYYPRKGETIQITYTIADNTELDVTKIVLEETKSGSTTSKIYDFSEIVKNEDGVYKIFYTAPTTSGIVSLKVVGVAYNNQDITIENAETNRIDVLKTAPKILLDEYESIADYESKQITFKFDVNDPDGVLEEEDGFIKDAYATFGGFQDTNGDREVKIKRNNNEITFINVTPGKVYLFDARASYDLDTNLLDEELGYKRIDTNAALIRIAAFILEPDTLEINNITTYNEEGNITQYLNKNELFTMSFTSQVFTGNVDGKESPFYPISANISIDNEEGRNYELIRNGSIYNVKGTFGGFEEGEHIITIHSVTLNNNQVGKLEDESGEKITGKTAQVEVLKEKLTVQNFKVNTTNEQTKVSFEMEDIDDTFVSGEIAVTNLDNSNDKMPKWEFKKDGDKYELTSSKILTPLNLYQVELLITYDLDYNKESIQNQVTESFGSTQVKILGEDGISITDLHAVKAESENVTLQFTSTNESGSTITSVTINGKSYTAIPGDNNTYTVIIPTEDFGKERAELTIQKININGREINNINISTVVYRNAPTVQILETKVSGYLTDISAKLNITDSDKTITKLYANLKDASGIVIKTIELDSKATEVNFTSSEKMLKAGTYTIEIKADYDLVDGQTYHKVTMATGEETKVAKKVKITNVEAAQYYVPRKSSVDIIYTIDANTDETVTGIYIDNVIYPATNNRNGTYTVTLPVHSTIGKIEFTATRIYYDKEEIILDETQTVIVNVLKQKVPTITELFVDDKIDSPDNPVVSFKINDEEDTFVTGKVIIANKQGIVQEIPIESKDITTFEIAGLKEKIEYTVSIEITYDLDEFKDNTDNQYTMNIGPHNFTITIEYGFRLNDFKIRAVDTQEKEIVLEFESDNNIKLEIEKVVINETEYDVKRDGEKYIVKVPYEQEERTELQLNMVILSNLHEISDELGQKVVAFKTKPTSEVEANLSEDATKFHITYHPKDEDSTISNLYVKLRGPNNMILPSKNANGEIQEVHPLNIEETEVTLASSDDMQWKAGNYRIEIVADYDLKDGKALYERETIGIIDYRIDIDANITDVTAEGVVSGSPINVQKGEDVILQYTILSNTAEAVDSLTINDAKYTATLNKYGTYNITYNIPQTQMAGDLNLTVSQIEYANGTIIETDYTSKVHVLKSIAPVATGIGVEKEGDKHKLSFVIEDLEDTVVKARITVTAIFGEDEEEVFVKDITSTDELPIVLENMENYGTYYVSVELTYTFNDDKKDNLTYQKVTSEKVAITITGEYEFGLENLRIKNVDTDRKVIVLNFKGPRAQAKDYDIAKVIVNDGTRDITCEVMDITGTTYTVELPYIDTSRKEITLNKAILNNAQEYAVENQKVVAFKSMPTIATKSNIVKENGQVSLEFTISDLDEAITKVYGAVGVPNEYYTGYERILEGYGPIEATRIEGNKYKISIKLPPPGQYGIMILVDYDRLDGKPQEKYTLTGIGGYGFQSESSVTIVKVEPEMYYIEKPTKEIDVTYTIEDNADIDIQELKINDSSRGATKVAEGQYKVRIVTIPTESGVYELNLSRVIYDGGLLNVNMNRIDKVEVLKDHPYFDESSFYRINDRDNNRVTFVFDIIDKDKTGITGKATVETSTGTETHNVKAGNNKITFTVPIGEIATLKIHDLKYDRDTDELNDITGEQNEYQLEDIVKEFALLEADYSFNITEMKIVRETDSVTANEFKYFAKDEKIKVVFDSESDEDVPPAYIRINGKSYPVVRSENKFYAIIDPIPQAGVTAITIQDAILLDSTFYELNDMTRNVEILKTAPSITNVNHTIAGGNKANVTFDLIDNDNAMTGVNISVIAQDGTEVQLEKQEIKVGKSEFEFNRTIDSEIYNVTITLKYDLNINRQDNEYEGKLTVDRKIDITERYIEMKDIEDIDLYRKMPDGTTQILSSVKKEEVEELKDSSQYIVKVRMKYLPEFYATIKDIVIENNVLKFKLNYDMVAQYNGNNIQDGITVTFGTLQGDVYKNETFADLVAKLKKGGNVTLTKNYDAAGYEGEASNYIISSFNGGIINGDGYTIYNLSKPLFNDFSGTIYSLTLENVSISAQMGAICYGGIANNGSGSFTSVHIKNMSQFTHWGFSGYGGFIGRGSGTFKACSISNINISGEGEKVGGFIGNASSAVSIEDCYITGSIVTTGDGSNRRMIAGGFIGSAGSSATINRCYAKIDMNCLYGPGGNGAIIGEGTNATITNCLSLGTGYNAYTISGGNVKSSRNNYELDDSTLKTNSDNSFVVTNKINKADITSGFFEGNLGFSMESWNYDGASYDNLPDISFMTGIAGQDTSKIYLPDRARLESLDEYNSKKEIAYANLYKLMPFYDAKYLVEDGNKLKESDELNQKLIKSVIAYDKNHKAIYALTDDKKDSIKTIRVVFEDGTSKEYIPTYFRTYANVASYTININGQQIGYNYEKYVIKQDVALINELVEKIKSIDGNAVQNIKFVEYGNRIYVDYYNETTKEKAKEIVLNYLSSVNAITSDNELVQTIIKNDLINNNNAKLKRILYTYNFITRWYDIEVNGAKISDLMLFKEDIYSSLLGITNLTQEVLGNEVKRNTNVTRVFYRETLAGRTGCTDIPAFIEYNVKVLETDKSAEDWFTEYYGARQPLVECPAEGYKDTLDYRAWTQLKKQDEFLLPILTLPVNSGYMVSAPTNFLIGSQYNYLNDKNNEEQRKTLETKMQQFGKQMANFYANLAPIINDESYLNAFADIQIDTKTLPGSCEFPGTQDAGTNEPFSKNFNEVTNTWSTIAGSGAYAGSGRVYWVVYRALNDFKDWTHETGHNQDSKLFFKGKAYRPGAGPEDYTDGNTNQAHGDGNINFNLITNYTMEDMITTNLTPERINSPEKIWDYYRKMFETTDFLDYVEAKAFLRLTPEEQSKVAIQIYYPGDPTGEIAASNKANPNTYANVGFRVLSAEEFEKMHLETIDDLYENRITIKPGVTGNSVLQGIGTYGAEGIYVRHWYQAHNDYGRTYSYGFKSLAWEMLGIGGYDNGYITFYSGASNNDLDALRKVISSVKANKDYDSSWITDVANYTWEQYKKDRFALMESIYEENIDDNFNNTNNNAIPYLNAKELEEEFYEALKIDAENTDRNVTRSTNVRRTNYHYLKRVTNDFTAEVLKGSSASQTINISTPKEFQAQITANPTGNFVLTQNIDLSSLTGETAIIDKAFMGKLDGNGFKLIGNTLPIFKEIKFANITNLTIEDTNITTNSADIGALTGTARNIKLSDIKGDNITISSSNKEIGGLIGIAYNSSLKNIHMTHMAVSASSRAGNLIGYADGVKIEECSTNGKVTSTGNAIGGFIGELVGSSSVRNCYSLGEIKGNADNGGFIGYVNSSTITNCFSAVSTPNGTIGTGGFVGQSVNNSKITNNIALGNHKTSYKFDARTAANAFTNYSNNYEYAKNAGTPTRTRGINLEGKISVASNADVTNPNFYTNALNWNNNIWDLTPVVTGGVPKLKNGDPNGETKIIPKYEISSVEEFIEKLNATPNAEYILTTDLDFEGKTYGSSIITTDFAGIIQGGGHTISNVKNASLFNNFSGKVYDLNIHNFEYNAQNQNYVTAFAKQTSNAIFNNMNFSNIKLYGNNYVGVITGLDQSNSIFENISIEENQGTNIVSASGNYGGYIAGRKYSGSIKDCYAQGTLLINNTESAGIVGATHSNTTIENVIANITARVVKNNDKSGRTNYAGFVGNIYDNPRIINSVSLGNTKSDDESKYAVPKKFTGASDGLIVSSIENCYESNVATGTSNVNDVTGNYIKAATSDRLKSKDFYVRLGFRESYIDESGKTVELWDFTEVPNGGAPRLKNSGGSITQIAEITSKPVKEAVEKNESSEIRYTITTTTNVAIAKLVFDNGIEKDVTLNTDGTYSVHFDGTPTAGYVYYNLTKVKFENGEIIELATQHTTRIVVLKQVPTIKEVTYNFTSGKPSFTVEFDDPDDALVGANYQAVCEDPYSLAGMGIVPITKGKNTVSLTFYYTSRHRIGILASWSLYPEGQNETKYTTIYIGDWIDYTKP